MARLWDALRRYDVKSIVGGFFLRRNFTSAGLVLRAGKGPKPLIENHGVLESPMCTLWAGTRIEVAKGARLTIGKGTYLNRNTTVVCHNRISIGAACRIAYEVIIMDTDEHEVPGGGPITEPVEIGDDVWLGARVIVLKGSRIGRGAIVGAGSIVRGELPPYSISVGQPAKVIRLYDPPTTQ
jgi:acetyltransferase-like isoleucine patch superfamily enzyme